MKKVGLKLSAIAFAAILLTGVWLLCTPDDSYAVGGTIDGITWNYDEGMRTLSIDGTGTVNYKDLEYEDDSPWKEYEDLIDELYVGEGITYLGGFFGYDELDTVYLPASLIEIYNQAFEGDTDLQHVYIAGDTKIEYSFDQDEDWEQFICPFTGCSQKELVIHLQKGLGTQAAEFCEDWGYRIAGEKGSLKGAVIDYKGYPKHADVDTTVCGERVWTGKKITFAPKLWLYEDVLTFGTDFWVKNTNNKNVGLANTTAYGQGDYRDSKGYGYFVIYPKGTSVKNVKAGKKKLTVKWNKQAKKMSKKRINGYIIEVATNKAFTKNYKRITVKGYKKVSKTIKGLKGGKRYYVHVQTYMDVKSGDVTDRFFSSWSKTKSVKVKK